MRILWADLAKAHRDLIATKALDDGPFLTRLWYHHLFWLCSFLKSAVTIKASGIGFLVRRQCYRAADRLFGGTREEAYCEKLNRNAETLRGRVEQLKTQQQERAERRFDREEVYQALTNPHFVATPHTHQDRPPAQWEFQIRRTAETLLDLPILSRPVGALTTFCLTRQDMSLTCFTSEPQGIS